MLKRSIQAILKAVFFPTRLQYSRSVYGKVKKREKRRTVSSVALKQEKEMAIISLFYRIVLSMINEFIKLREYIW